MKHNSSSSCLFVLVSVTLLSSLNSCSSDDVALADSCDIIQNCQATHTCHNGVCVEGVAATGLDGVTIEFVEDGESPLDITYTFAHTSSASGQVTVDWSDDAGSFVYERLDATSSRLIIVWEGYTETIDLTWSTNISGRYELVLDDPAAEAETGDFQVD